jgi:hypothetical protein
MLGCALEEFLVAASSPLPSWYHRHDNFEGLPKTHIKVAPSWREKKARSSYLNCSCPDSTSNLTKTRRIPKSLISYTPNQLSAMSHSRMKHTLSNDSEFESTNSDWESGSDSDLPSCCKLEARSSKTTSTIPTTTHT